MSPEPNPYKPASKIFYLTEAFCWVAGIGLLAFSNPHNAHLFSFCPFSWVLENGCPGCGLGHAIGFLFRGAWAASWEAHPLALPALLLLAHRVFAVVKNYYSILKINPNL